MRDNRKKGWEARDGRTIVIAEPRKGVNTTIRISHIGLVGWFPARASLGPVKKKLTLFFHLILVV